MIFVLWPFIFKEIVYAKAAAAPAHARGEEHHETAQAQASTAAQTASSETPQAENSESATTSLGRGALLMVTLGKPLSRLAHGDDRDADASDDTGGSPRSLPVPVGKKRTRKESKEQKSRGFLAKHRAQKRHVSVKPNPQSTTPLQKDQLAAQFASFAEADTVDASEVQSSGNNSGHEEVTVLATGGIAFGSSVMFIQHCRSASQTRQSSSRPTLPQYTGTTVNKK